MKYRTYAIALMIILVATLMSCKQPPITTRSQRINDYEFIMRASENYYQVTIIKDGESVTIGSSNVTDLILQWEKYDKYTHRWKWKNYREISGQ